MLTTYSRVFILATAGTLASACGDLLDISNPGPISDADLNTAGSMPALVTGMSADLSVALATTTTWGSVWSDDLLHSGTLGAPRIFADGSLDAVQINPWWNSIHRARWVAENGIGRMQEVLGADFEASPLSARANVLAGFANRILGENVCHAVIDGGPATSYLDHFSRAESYFSEALRLASAQGNAAMVNTARAGRAQVRAAQGNWAAAAEDAGQVPLGFRYDAVFSLNTARESHGWVGATITRGEYTVWGTRSYEVAGDPRIAWEEVRTATGTLQAAANGQTPWVRQRKYNSDADDIALARGTEMALIRAEAALRGSGVAAAMEHVNQVRAFHGLDPLAAATAVEAWPILQEERRRTLWLEGRRFWDLRRWFEEQGPAHNSFLADRDRCVPISDNERNSNPNIS